MNQDAHSTQQMHYLYRVDAVLRDTHAAQFWTASRVYCNRYDGFDTATDRTAHRTQHTFLCLCVKFLL
jgi:hypothetical protein